MQIDRLPGLYYEENVTYELSGVGSKIPIFIGRTGNTGSDEHKVDGTEVLKFTRKSDALADTTKGGIGAYYGEVDEETTVINPNNKLARVISEFFDEARLTSADEIGVPYIYVIDVGNGETYTSWTNAVKTSKTLLDASVEVYVGAYIAQTKEDDPQTEGDESKKEVVISKKGNEFVTLIGFLSQVADGFAPRVSDEDPYDDYGLRGSARNLDLRYAFASFEAQGTHVYPTPQSDEDRISDDIFLKGLTDSNGFRYSRVGICEPLLFGKTIARICCTPNNTEPGYYTYRSVETGTFNKRTKAEMLDLQNAGIIFNNDEHINDKIYPKINLCVSTSFARNPRPADSMFHARFNADSLLRDVFEACYNQIKANESATNIAYLQTRVNKLVNDRVVSEEMVKYNEKTGKGTKLIVTATEDDPYRLVVSGQIHPIKCTIAILINATVVI